VSCAGNPVFMCVVQVDACRRKATRGVDTQGRRGRDTGSYVDRGERREAPRALICGGFLAQDTRVKL
jgi:hypothetical protein